MTVRNPDRYLAAVIDDYRDECVQGFTNEYEAKRLLWKTAVVIYEVAEDPEPWLDEIREIALGHIKPRRIEVTIRSAARRAGGRYAT